MDYTTANDVKDALASYEITWDTNFDTILAAIISGISAKIDRFCNRSLARQVFTEYHSGVGAYIFVKNPPIVLPSGENYPITILGDDFYEWSPGASITDFTVINPAIGQILHRAGCWGYGKHALKVTYTGGLVYLAGEQNPVLTIPADLKLAATMQAAYEFRRRKDLGLESVVFPDGSAQKMSGDLLPQAKAILMTYRLPNG